MEHCKSMLPANSCQLTTLPQSVLAAVLKCLDSTDKHCLASTFRSLASSVSSIAQRCSVTVTSKTRLAGLRQVLSARTINCTQMRLNGKTTSSRAAMLNAIDIMLGPNTLHGLEFHGIQELTIFVRRESRAPWRPAPNLPCLLPPNLARMLPDLQVLNVNSSLAQTSCKHQLQPLPFCRSLRKIVLNDYRDEDDDFTVAQLQMPGKYHTAEELKRQLPNVSELYFMVFLDRSEHALKQDHVCCVNTMLQAWGPQLDVLDLSTDTTSTKDVLSRLQHCTQLQKLTWYQWEPFGMMIGLPMCLTSLNLRAEIEEACLPCILQLPKLKSFTFKQFNHSLQHDWSDHPCTWQQVKVEHLALVDLSKLPLHSLRGDKCLEAEIVTLPDPLIADSLAKVAQAAQCVMKARITVSGMRAYKCEAWNGMHVDHQTDAATAQLLTAVSGCVHFSEKPGLSVNIISSFPQTAAALFQWSANDVRCVQVSDHVENLAKVQPWFWHALLCCRNLERVSFGWYSGASAHIIGSVVLQACEQMMAVRDKQLLLTFATPQETVCS